MKHKDIQQVNKLASGNIFTGVIGKGVYKDYGSAASFVYSQNYLHTIKFNKNT
jgi:hypothetical protein